MYLGFIASQRSLRNWSLSFISFIAPCDTVFLIYYCLVVLFCVWLLSIGYWVNIMQVYLLLLVVPVGQLFILHWRLFSL